jgi:hypothetical protein
MKKLLLLAVITVIGVSTQAQFSFGPAIDLGSTTLRKSGDSQDPNRTYKSEGSLIFGIGGEVRYRFSDILSIHSGLYYQNLSPKYKRSSFTDYWTEKYKLNYISLPLELVYGKEKGFYGGAGINFDLGISGNYTSAYQLAPSLNKNKTIKFDGSNTDLLGLVEHLKSFNAGVIFTAGYNFGPYFVGANALVGLSNVSPYNNTSVKGNALTIHAGYLFNCNSSAL